MRNEQETCSLTPRHSPPTLSAVADLTFSWSGGRGRKHGAVRGAGPRAVMNIWGRPRAGSPAPASVGPCLLPCLPAVPGVGLTPLGQGSIYKRLTLTHNSAEGPGRRAAPDEGGGTPGLQ